MIKKKYKAIYCLDSTRKYNLLAYKETSHTTDEVRSVKLFPGLFLENFDIIMWANYLVCSPFPNLMQGSYAKGLSDIAYQS